MVLSYRASVAHPTPNGACRRFACVLLLFRHAEPHRAEHLGVSMATYPTQHETFVAMIAEVQRKRAEMKTHIELSVKHDDEPARERELVTTAA